MKSISSLPSDILDRAYQVIQQDPEGQSLVQSFEKQGGRLAIHQGSEPKGVWSWAKKQLSLSEEVLASFPNALGYLAFELFNALKTNNFEEILRDPTLTLDQRVKRFEKEEYQSGIDTRRLVLRILGDEEEFDHKHVIENFDHSYLLQQLIGHSQSIAKTYAKPGETYQGSRIDELGHNGKEYLKGLLYYSLRKDAESQQKFHNILWAIKKLAPTDPVCRHVQELWENPQ